MNEKHLGSWWEQELCDMEEEHSPTPMQNKSWDS